MQTVRTKMTYITSGFLVLTITVATCLAQRNAFQYELRQGSLGFMSPGSALSQGMDTGAQRTFGLANLQAVNQVKPFVDNTPMIAQSQPSMTLTNMIVPPSPEVPDCPLEVHPDTETMFIMRGPLGDPEPRTCPPGTYFLRSVCSCVNTPADKCNLRPSAISGWYEENVFGIWIQRPCGPGSAFNPSTCDCSYTL